MPAILTSVGLEDELVVDIGLSEIALCPGRYVGNKSRSQYKGGGMVITTCVMCLAVVFRAGKAIS